MFKFNKKIIIISIGFLVVGFLIWSIPNLSEIKELQAGAEDNVYGWAWSENIGWISFNNTSGEGSVNYGVHIDQVTGIFSGYAWSENIGWISFNQSELSGCPSGTCRAEVDLSSYEVSGWVRALAYGGGWDGWIRLRGSNYGVKINNTSQELEGWAWGDNVVGWISFNCNNPETPTACSDSDYKVKTSFVFNQPPQVEFPEIEYEQYCGVFTGRGLVWFKWTYQDDDGDNESRFDFRVNDINNVNDLNREIDRTSDNLDNPSGTTNNQSVSIKSPLEPNKITFGKTYYWWARVWDSEGNNSGWVAGPSFITDSHSWPYPDFSWSPPSPSAGEITQFCAVREPGVCLEDKSTCYNTSGAISPPSCFDKSFLWSFSPDTVDYATGTSPTSKNPRVKFLTQESYTATLQITDDLGTCGTDETINITLPLPEWEEAAP